MKLLKSCNFKKLTAFTLVFFLTLSFSYAKKADKPVSPVSNEPTQISEEPAEPKLKKILVQLIKQNNYMDDVLEEIKESRNNLTLTQIASLDLTFNIINKNLKQIALLTKEALIEIQPNNTNSTYAKTILRVV